MAQDRCLKCGQEGHFIANCPNKEDEVIIFDEQPELPNHISKARLLIYLVLPAIEIIFFNTSEVHTAVVVSTVGIMFLSLIAGMIIGYQKEVRFPITRPIEVIQGLNPSIILCFWVMGNCVGIVILYQTIAWWTRLFVLSLRISSLSFTC